MLLPCLDNWKPVLELVALAATPLIALFALRNWNRELKGRAHFEAAKNLARAVYKLRDEIQLCRSRFIMAHEFPEGEQGLSLAYDAKKYTGNQKAQGIAFVYQNRWVQVGHAIAELEPCALECEALWGHAIREQSNLLLLCARDLSIAIKTFLTNEESDWKLFKEDDALRERTMKSMYVSVGEEFDPLSQKIKVAIDDIDNTLRPYLGRGRIREKGP
jgi:hypothetical protein